MNRKKKFSFMMIIWMCICICSILIWLPINMYMHQHPNIKVGEVWVNEYDTDNPFEEVQRDTIDIISVKGDYVLYVNRSRNDTISNTKHWTTILARKIKNVK